MHWKRARSLAVIWTGLLATSLLIPPSAFPRMSWHAFLGFDKLVHLGLFYMLVSLWLLYYEQLNRISRKLKSLVFILSVAYGGSLEYVQGAMAIGRNMDIADALANTIGALLGVILLPFTKRSVTFLKKYLPFIGKLYKS